MLYTQELDNKIREYIDANRDEALAFWKDLVNHEGQHGEKEYLLQTAGFLKTKFEELGLKVDVLDAGENNAPVVTALLNPDAPGRPVVFSGHYDTVFAALSRGKDPFRVEDGIVYGPGCCDMKGGIAIAYNVVKTLIHLGFRECPVRLFFVGDEEVNHIGGTAISLIKEYTTDILVAFNMENRYESGEVCVGRKGDYEYKVVTRGVGSHPGHAFDAGRNAIEEMAYKIIGLQQCTPKEKDRDFSVSVDVIRGGTVTNVIPDYCEAMVDVRIRSLDALAEAERRMNEVIAQQHVPDTTTELILCDAMPPFENTPQVNEAYATLKAISDTIGSNITGPIQVGGASDSAHMPAGTKIVCQCGVMGGLTHNIGEYARLDSLYEGIRLFTFAVLNHQLFE